MFKPIYSDKEINDYSATYYLSLPEGRIDKYVYSYRFNYSLKRVLKEKISLYGPKIRIIGKELRPAGSYYTYYTIFFEGNKECSTYNYDMKDYWRRITLPRNIQESIFTVASFLIKQPLEEMINLVEKEV